MVKSFLQDQEVSVAILLVWLWATTDPPAPLLAPFGLQQGGVSFHDLLQFAH